MLSNAETVAAYLEELPEERKAAMKKLQQVIKKNLPTGFKEVMSFGMIGYVVPHSTYPAGYHCKPTLPLPFINIASQKNFIAIYHMGIYAKPDLLHWFTAAYATLEIGKPDMGKSCIRFKKPANIPYELIGTLSTKVTVQEWVNEYENAFLKK